MPALPLAAVFADPPDPSRDTRNKLHALTVVLTLATCAVIGGAETWDGIAVFGRAKEAFFRRILKLANGTPSPDTAERVRQGPTREPPEAIAVHEQVHAEVEVRQ